MIELAIATGRPFAELAELDDQALATMLDVLDERRRVG